MIHIQKKRFTLLCLSALILVTVLPLSACGSKKLDSGEIIESAYVNESIGMTITLPDGFTCNNTPNQELKMTGLGINTLFTADYGASSDPSSYASVTYGLLSDNANEEGVKETQKVMEQGVYGDEAKVTIGTNDFAHKLFIKQVAVAEFNIHSYVLHRDNYSIIITATFTNDQLYQQFLTSLETLTFE